jgi:uncharacterized membrane protein YdfJ with MMPL/SSD domain
VPPYASLAKMTIIIIIIIAIMLMFVYRSIGTVLPLTWQIVFLGPFVGCLPVGSVWRAALPTVTLTDHMVRFMPGIGGRHPMSVGAGSARGGEFGHEG